MKKLLVVLLSLLALSGCGSNMDWGFGSYTFTKVHCVQENKCVEIETWFDNERGIEVKTKDGSLYFSEGTYILIEDKCPFCSGR